MYLYRKPKTQRKCSKPSTDKQRRQRFFAWMLFRLKGMQTNWTHERFLPLEIQDQAYRVRQEVMKLEELVKQKLRNL